MAGGRGEVTLDEVATAAGVSRSTVSRVINGAGVSPEASARVKRALEDVRYVSTAARRRTPQNDRAVDSSPLAADVDAVLRALADPTRRRVIEILAHRPAAISALANQFELSIASMIPHVNTLERAGLVVTEKVGRVRTASLQPGGLDPLRLWLDGQRTPAERQADRLGVHLSHSLSEGKR